MKKEKRIIIFFIISIIIFLIAFNVWLTKEQSKGLQDFKGYTNEQCKEYYNNYLTQKNN